MSVNATILVTRSSPCVTALGGRGLTICEIRLTDAGRALLTPAVTGRTVGLTLWLASPRIFP